MSRLRSSDLRDHLQMIREAILSSADAEAAVAKHLRLAPRRILAGPYAIPLPHRSRIFVVGLGKASPAMCQAAAGALGSRLTRGVAAVPRTWTGPAPPRMEFLCGGHPLPDGGSLAAGEAVARMLAGTGPGDIVVVLISGGGSAMIELPIPGICLEDLDKLNSLLLRSGAPIGAVNIVRKGLSQFKGGGLARMAAPAQVISLVVSDVIGDRLSTIASGPTVPLRPDPASAVKVLRRLGLWSAVPDSVRRALSASCSWRPCSPRPMHILVGSNRLVVGAVAREASRLGFACSVLSHQMQGEARQVGRRLARKLLRARAAVVRAKATRQARPHAACFILGGETSVTVTGSGSGGRNQELALAAAQVLDGEPGLAVMAFATDGVDGPTDAAGAVVTGETARLARLKDLDLSRHLDENNAYPLLEVVGALIRTGPTGTNVGDLVVGLIYP